MSLRRSLKYACIFILAISPFSLLYDVGFLLSFSAIIGIVLFQKLMEVLFPTSKKEKKSDTHPKFSRKMKISSFLTSFLKEYGIPTF
ncbi:ComEC/Rec2 family competence protein [bacterium]|nr:ComEC/Rec2 family competence protein [bacterium]